MSLTYGSPSVSSMWLYWSVHFQLWMPWISVGSYLPTSRMEGTLVWVKEEARGRGITPIWALLPGMWSILA